MKSKLRIACAALLATAATQAMALQLGQIQVKSALNQPLVAAIPLHPKNLTELEGLTVALAPASDFQRAGLELTPTDQTLRFHVVTDNNGQKLILVTSSQPITSPYLDFLVQVNTRQAKQVREFVVLLNPVIAAPAPAVQTAPVASAQPRTVQPAPQPQLQQSQSQSLEFPPPLVTPKKAVPTPAPKPANAAPAPKPQPEPQAKSQPEPARPQSKPAPAPKAPVQSRSQPAAASPAQATVAVAHGDTLYGIARQHTNGTRGSINRMMLALQAANPDAFFKDNIDNLKAGAILRIPTRDEIDKISIAEANAEVHRQYEEWRAAKPHPATVLAGSAARAAARSAPQPVKAAPASDHLSLTPPTGKGSGANNRAGVAGGTGSETVAGLRQQLQNDRGSLISLDQANADLVSRVQSLKAISGKSDKLLSLKGATVAELQRKLAQVQAGKPGVATSAGAATVASGSTAAAATPASSAVAATKPAASASNAAHAAVAKKPSAKPATQPSRNTAQPWYERPIAWIVAGLIVLALILVALFTRTRRPGAPAPARGPLSDPDDVCGTSDATPPQPEPASDEEALYARLAEHPGDLEAHLQLCRLFYTRDDADRFVEAAEAMHEEITDAGCAEWREVRVMGEALAPHHPLFVQHIDTAAPEDPYGLTALRQSPDSDDDATIVRAPGDDVPVAPTGEPHDVVPPPAEIPEAPPAIPAPAADEPAFSDDPVDTKLDLARAYLDMGDPVGARAMLEEVIEEGSQTQKDEAKRLLAEAGPSD